ncbi:hypothetical protein HID58_041599 [Brassica napus]|uniref:RNase H type-1 domain-containing protein n=1 Tax=Brassica napus TaxID=3708 RepID=A0ABQ8BBB7_BRANA|nr:hypothetical protein HID58_041599 [Brassica napus]
MIYSSQLIDYCVIKGLVDSTFSSLSVQGPPPLLPALLSTIGVSAHGSEFGPPGFPVMFPEISEQDRRSAMVYRNARIQRVRQAITYAARAPPVILTKITPDLDKGKGHVFDYPDISSLLQWHATKKLKITSSARLTLLENESETESSTASLPALLPPFDITTGFQLGISSKDPTAGDGKGDKKARRRPPSGKRKTQGRLALRKWFVEVGTAAVVITHPSWIDCQGAEKSYRGGKDLHSSILKLVFSVNNDTCVPGHDIAQPLPLSDHWVRPPMGFLKCNISSAWDHLSGLSGAGWLLRDHQGTPLNHSRRAFSESTSRREADLKSLLWAVESMVNMRLKNVILEASSIELRESLLEPHQYPELKSLIERILLLFFRLDSWSLIHVHGSRNRVSTAIDVSIIANFRTQSYVATGGPSWLSHTILSEAQAV